MPTKLVTVMLAMLVVNNVINNVVRKMICKDNIDFIVVESNAVFYQSSGQDRLV